MLSPTPPCRGLSWASAAGALLLPSATVPGLLQELPGAMRRLFRPLGVPRAGPPAREVGGFAEARGHPPPQQYFGGMTVL